MNLPNSILVVAAMALMSRAYSQQDTSRVIFFGDSITEVGVKPGGYITRLRDAIDGMGLGRRFELIGSGISGNKVYDLYLRLEEDVLSKHPDVVVVYVGVNDVWHKTLAGTGTDADKFEKFYTAIIRKLQREKIRLVLCTPAVIGERVDNSNQHDGDLNLYSQIIRTLAARFNCSLCDLRKGFVEYNAAHNSENVSSGILTSDKVHLNDRGNQLVAEMLLPLLLR